MVLSALHDSLHHGITISNWNIQSLLSHQPHCSSPSDFVAPDWTPHCMGSNTGYAYEFIWRNAEEKSKNTASTRVQFMFFFLRDVFVWMCLRVRDIFKCACVCVSHSTSLADIQGESGSLIDWCWFHLGSEQQLTVDLSRCERQPLILVLFKQHVLIYVIFTKSAREERLPFYVWLFIEVRGVPLYNPSMLPTRHLHRSGRVPEKWDPTPRINNCQGSHLRQSAQENLNV